MKRELEILGLNEKEITVYLYLIEYGVSSASEISKRVGIPKSTINFIASSLWERGILKKTMQAKTGFFEANPENLQDIVLLEIQQKQDTLKSLIPELHKKNEKILSKPQIYFLDGLESCKSAYNQLLHIKEKVFYEFGAHRDLESAFGKDYMNGFIGNRILKRISCKAIGTVESTMSELQKMDEKHLRDLKVFSNDMGNISSSITIYDDSVLILNLKSGYKGICIENSDFAETMKTIFRICKS